MKVPISGAMIGMEETNNLIDVARRQWFTEGQYCKQFEDLLCTFTNRRFISLCNSGSSANLLAITALCDKMLDNHLEPGSEVITTALNFPTTVNPIFQNGLVPVFLDVTIPEYNVNVNMLEDALSERTRAVVFSHTLGLPFEAVYVRNFCDRHGLWMVEDCCDALGADCGYLGDLATYSFFPAHHITTGEGGAVTTNNAALDKIIKSIRDWGRDCWCLPGANNTCGKRWDSEVDHKYLYTRMGYNLKMTDMQAAIGVAQMGKLPEFIEKRSDNFRTLNELAYAANLSEWFELPYLARNRSPFGYPLLSKVYNRNDLCKHLDQRGIDTRAMMGGNLLRHPLYNGLNYRIIGDLVNSNKVYDNAFWIGCWPGLDYEQMDYAISTIEEYCR